ncbi:Aste57867_18424 [Aphanomyces stellatus]|uniref:Aste57867_18424 protein n=1 Tax=Aphanomyces stellatus TaxID=120398 RepID=A0A485LAX5_9STRA|nr:hypothetical protein As57867_018362 [Aphanomyces stellatus]VFT95160.1 Aste57867_18424 [Aphanomyces stellatus]
MRNEFKHLVVDSRSSQVLEPLRVPSKLKDRFDKAHKRFANKDGFVFTTDAATPPREAAKKNLPDVIMRNKLMAFESKWHCTTKTSVFYDPLDSSFERLTMEEREEVMNRIQSRVEQITESVEEKYRRRKQELDDQAIFDPAINKRRVQTMCLVDLQRNCNLDALKIQVLREFEDERRPGSKVQAGPRRASVTPTPPLNVLDQILKETTDQAALELKGSKKLQRMFRTQESIAKCLSESSLQPANLERRRSKRLGSLDSTASMHTLAMVAAVVATTSTKQQSQNQGASEHQAMVARHPDVASIVAALRTEEAKTQKKRARGGLRPGQDVAAKPESAVDEWKDQVDLFALIGARLNASLRRRAEGNLADYTATPVTYPELWTDLVRFTTRLRAKQATLAIESQASIDAPDHDRLSTRKANTQAKYHQCQDAILSRRRRQAKSADAASAAATALVLQSSGAENKTSAAPATHAPHALERRPSTILDERLNRLARRQPTVATSLVGARSEKAAVVPMVKHTSTRMLKRRKSALSWEWQTLTDPAEAKQVARQKHAALVEATAAAATHATATATEEEKAGAVVGIGAPSSGPSPRRSSHYHRVSSVAEPTHEALQRRLEDVWQQLGMPYRLRLTMLEKYASHDGAEALHAAIDVWEAAADAVVLREVLLAVRMATQAHQDLVPEEVDEYWAQLHDTCLVLPEVKPTPESFGAWVDSVMPAVTDSCKEALMTLFHTTGDVLTYEGNVYLEDELVQLEPTSG